MTRPIFNEQTFLDCKACRTCKGSGYIVSPILAIGEMDAPILIVAQNPGIFDPIVYKDFVSRWESASNYDEVKIAGYLDFAATRADSQFARVFGQDWLESGKICYTNAVRCRTPNNDAPTAEMVSNCRYWTRYLLENRKLVVTCGWVPTNQVSQGKMGMYETKRLVGDGAILMSIYHYAAWRNEHVSRNRQLFIDALKLAGLEEEYVPKY